MQALRALLDRDRRTVVGLMSGTSLDGVDAVLARLEGSGRALRIEQLAFVHRAYAPGLRALLLENSAPETSSVRDLSQLNVRLCDVYVEAVREAVEAAGLAPGTLDLVGSHGQTVHHVPTPEDCGGRPTTSTLQIGDPSVLANRLGTVTVGDFRVADMALGGQGAPLVPYFDYVYFAQADETRGLLNLGGIANLSVLPAGEGPEAVYAFDTGPANMVADLLARRFFDRPYDPAGALALEGTVDEGLLARWLADPYFAEPPPKSTGRERYGAAFADRLVDEVRPATRQDRLDLLATATALTPDSVYLAYERFVAPRHRLDAVIASGGGVRNEAIMGRLQARFAPIPVRTVADFGLEADAKEALCFAVLAHEALNGVPTSLPSVTGAAHPTILGKICVPGAFEAARP